MPPKKRKSLTVQQPKRTPIERWACPACQKQVPSFFINSHLDLECSFLHGTQLTGTASGTGCKDVKPGLNPQYSSPAENPLLHFVNECPFVFVEECPLLEVTAFDPALLSHDKISRRGALVLLTSQTNREEEIEILEDPKRHVSTFTANNFDAVSTIEMVAVEQSDGKEEMDVYSGMAEVRECSPYKRKDHEDEDDSSLLIRGNVRDRQASGKDVRSSPFWEGTDGAICNSLHHMMEGSRTTGQIEDRETLSSPTRDDLSLNDGLNDVKPQFSCNAAVHCKGLQVVENFISLEEEEHLLHCLDKDFLNPWKISRLNGIHFGKAFGVSNLRTSFADKPLHPMPIFLRPYVERMRSQVLALKGFFPNEMNAIDYRVADGHYLKAHMDDRQRSGTTLVNLSLCGTCIMTYAKERGVAEIYRVKLRPRSLQILTGESRYNFTHGIQKDDFLSPRRVSLTFRQSVEVP